MNQPAVSGARDFEASGSGVAKSWDTSTGCQSGKKGQEALSTNIWPPWESRVWRPGEVSADDQLKSRRGHDELDGRWDMDLGKWCGRLHSRRQDPLVVLVLFPWGLIFVLLTT
jgi:hypothetical protein